MKAQQFVPMSKSGVKAYYSAMKVMRKEAAEFYRDNPTALLSEVAKRYKLPVNSMKKALAENGIEVERDRQFDRPVRRLLCRDCGERVHHVCKDRSLPVEREQRHERIDPRRIHPVTGRIVERTPDYIAYVEGSMQYEPPRGPDKPYSIEDNYLPGDTDEMKEYAVLGLEGIMDRVRAGLGIK